ncbi:caffeoylshikimate esterase-like [Bidens hawaiensis]|uniref:caffeoylshikimate esterase-like n=1 Tax=Bidens hawaiensis TaxID=980011 RepID=UPI00404B16BE
MVHPIAEANETSPFGSLTPDQFYTHHNISHSNYITNSRGLKLFTQSWSPLPPTKLTGLICAVHGYTGESSWFVQLTCVHLAKAGFAVCAIDHQGHGFSDGLQYHIPDINPVVDDCISYFNSFRESHAHSLPSFLYSESLGGAIALLITLRRAGKPYDGLILNGAMCGISDKYKPPWPLEHFLSLAATLIPTWRVVPTRGSIPDVSFKVEWKRKLATASPRRTEARPRASTARELLRICREVQSRFTEVDVPLLIIHGGDDRVCDPACVEDLYARAASNDKTLKMYPGMWHQLIGEEDDDVETVFGDVVEWLKARARSDGDDE